MKNHLSILFFSSMLMVATVLPGCKKDVEEGPKPPHAPGQPELVESNQQLTVSWNEVANATHYEVWHNTTNAASSATNSAENVVGTTFTINGLENGTTYYVWVKSKNKNGTSAFSQPATGTPFEAVSIPTTPGEAPGLESGFGQLTVTWTAIEGATSYEVWYNTSNSSGNATLAAENLTVTTYTITGLINGETYYVWIKAKNSAGTSGFSPPGSGVSPGKYSIGGRLTGISSGKGLGGISITYTGTSSGSVTTDEDGNFEISDIYGEMQLTPLAPENAENAVFQPVNRTIDSPDQDAGFKGGWNIKYAFGSYGGGDDQNRGCYGMAMDDEDNLYIADYSNYRIIKYNSRGEFLGWFGKGTQTTGWHLPGSGETGVSGTDNGAFESPYNIAVDSDGNLFVIDLHPKTITKFSKTGSLVTQWSLGMGIAPSGITVDDQGYVYVVEYSGNFIYKYKKGEEEDYTLHSKWAVAYSANNFGLAINKKNGDVYFSECDNHRIHIFSSNNGKDYELKQTVQGINNEFKYLKGLAFDNDGNLYVTSFYNRIFKLNSQMELVTSWSGSGTHYFTGVAVDSNNTVYAAGTGNVIVINQVD
jgi:hypothetical protein